MYIGYKSSPVGGWRGHMRFIYTYMQKRRAQTYRPFARRRCVSYHMIPILNRPALLIHLINLLQCIINTLIYLLHLHNGGSAPGDAELPPEGGAPGPGYAVPQTPFGPTRSRSRSPRSRSRSPHDRRAPRTPPDPPR